MEITLEALGITQDKLVELVVERLVENATAYIIPGEDGEPVEKTSRLWDALTKRVQHAIDTRIAALAEKNVIPHVTNIMENLVLQTTNKWGEKVGKPVTFIEYMTQRAEAYLTEPVNFEGKSKSEDGYGYGWKQAQTRISHLIHQHLHYSIETAMKNALGTTTSAIREGLLSTAKIKLEEFAKSMNVRVEVKS